MERFIDFLNPRFKDGVFAQHVNVPSTSHPWFGWFAFVEGSMGFGGKLSKPSVFVSPNFSQLPSILLLVSWCCFYCSGTPGEFPGVFV